MNMQKAIAPILNFLSKGIYFSDYYGYKYYNYYKNEHYLAHNILKEPKDFENILELIQESSVHEFRSPSKILPLDLDFSFSVKEVIKHKGNPRFILDKEYSLLTQQVLFYKVRISGFSFLTQFHFMNDSLWIIKQDISYQNASHENLGLITRLLLKKYPIEFVRSGTLNEQSRISDNHGNHMLIKHGIKTEILYFNLKPQIISIVNDWIKDSINNKVREDKSIEKKLLRNL